MVFSIKRPFVCIFCGEKKYDGMRFRSRCGMCADCDRSISRTTPGSSFAGSLNVKYVVSPLFYEDFVRDAIMRYKFEGWSGASEIFTYIIQKYISDFPHFAAFDAVLPVPLSKQRYNERGFNQSEPIAKAASAEIGIKYDCKSLTKVRHTQRQSRLTAGERVENVRYAYRASGVSGKRIILVDDIYTTGVTMEECGRTLISAGAVEVAALSLSIKYKKEKSLISRY